jgi:hypothetical protein
MALEPVVTQPARAPEFAPRWQREQPEAVPAAPVVRALVSWRRLPGGPAVPLPAVPLSAVPLSAVVSPPARAAREQGSALLGDRE